FAAVTASLGAGEPDDLAQVIEQQQVVGNGIDAPAAVEGEFQDAGHAASESDAGNCAMASLLRSITISPARRQWTARRAVHLLHCGGALLGALPARVPKVALDQNR